MVVLDTSALLALLFNETGAEQVLNVLPNALMSTVNLAEALSFYVRQGATVSDAFTQLASLPMQWLPFSAEHSAIAAGLLPMTKAHGLSLGDRACLALAIEKQLTVYTADRVWCALDLPITVIAIR